MQQELDQFFTPEKDAVKFINKVDGLYGLSTYDNIIEPSAGAGSFFKNLPKNAIGLDLEPLHKDIIKMDFFDYEFPKGKTIVIGNPPYGRRGSLALQFINKSAKYADVIAFVLPRGFKRVAMQNSVDLSLHLVYEEFIEDFELPCGKIHKVKSIFQVWEKREEKREKVEEPKSHPDFTLLHKHVSWITAEELSTIKEEYPLAIGQNKMRIEDSKNISKGSIWFVKPLTKNVREVFENTTFESAYWTTGAPSLSKGDIINGYEQTLSRGRNKKTN